MNPKLLTALSIISAVVVGSLVLFAIKDRTNPNNHATVPGQSSTQKASPVAQGPGATVVFQNGQFTPKTVTIKAGQSVSFINMSDSQIQVASDPHPTHTNLKGFQSNNLDKDDAYLFIFSKAGTWGYHDHLNPSNTGTVIVQ